MSILLVDDTPTNLQVLMHTLKDLGHKLLAANSGAQALAIARKARPQLILLDVMMPEMDGFAVCQTLKADPELSDIAIIFCSALDDTASKVRGLELGAVDFITKPFQAEEVIARVETQLTIQQLVASLNRRNTDLERELALAHEFRKEALQRLRAPLLGKSVAVKALRSSIAEAAKSDQPILIAAQPNCGDEAVARAIHDASPRKNKPFVTVECGALQGSIQAHVFTHHVESSAHGPSKLKLAMKGTLYLEGVHQLPSSLQDQLMEVLVEQEDAKTGQPDVRIIASTTQGADCGGFPGDYSIGLSQKLKRNVVRLPALAERADDIGALVSHFVKRHCMQLGRVIERIEPETLAELTAYTWPGNLSELEDVIRRSIVESRGVSLEVDSKLLEQGVPLGSYRLTERLGVGGMGEVWKGHHQLLARPAAIKLIKAGALGAAHERMVRRFEREARVTANLSSPNTVELYDFGIRDDGSFYYVMELLDGIDLEQCVRSHGPMPPARVAYLILQACRSLAEAHDADFVHRDIKPANLYICKQGLEVDILKVLDFGLVTAHENSPDTRLTMQNMLYGTPGYISPEGARSVGELTDKADIYAIGCIAYWLLTGALVFEAPSMMALLLKHVSDEPIPPSARIKTPIPKELERLVLQCMSKTPEDRPSAQELIGLLEETNLPGAWKRCDALTWWERALPQVMRATPRSVPPKVEGMG